MWKKEETRFFFSTSFKTAKVISSALTVVYDLLRRVVRRGSSLKEEFGGAKILQGLCDYIDVIFQRGR